MLGEEIKEEKIEQKKQAPAKIKKVFLFLNAKEY